MLNNLSKVPASVLQEMHTALMLPGRRADRIADAEHVLLLWAVSRALERQAKKAPRGKATTKRGALK